MRGQTVEVASNGGGKMFDNSKHDFSAGKQIQEDSRSCQETHHPPSYQETMNSMNSLLLVAGLLLSHAVKSSSGLSNNLNRRQYLRWQTRGCITAVVATTPLKSRAANLKSRTEGYTVQHSEREWAVSANLSVVLTFFFYLLICKNA